MARQLHKYPDCIAEYSFLVLVVMQEASNLITNGDVMGHFKAWLRERRIKEDINGSSPDNKFQSSQGDFGTDYERAQKELFSAVMSKYPTETLQFLDGIAQRGDEEVRSLLAKVRKDKQPNEFKKPTHPTDGDEVVPPAADTGYNSSFGGGD